MWKCHNYERKDAASKYFKKKCVARDDYKPDNGGRAQPLARPGRLSFSNFLTLKCHGTPAYLVLLYHLTTS
jgi:hypothetical protein